MIPKYLYQYTSIDALEKIYTDKTIRFTRLDLLNDPYEGIIKASSGEEIEHPKRNIYCSCWTANPQESIEMWGVYGSFRGLRIKMNSKMFSNKFSLIELNEGYIPVEVLNTPVEIKKSYASDSSPAFIRMVYGPYAISYVDDVDSTYCGAMIDSIPCGDVDIKTAELGNKKVSFWKYENEWRYKVSPYTDVVIPTYSLTTAPVNENDMFCLVPYEGEMLEVITAPLVEDKTIQRLKALLGDKYNELVKRSDIKMNKIDRLTNSGG